MAELVTVTELTDRILAADPALADAIEIGLAWQRVEAALTAGEWLCVEGDSASARTVGYHPDSGLPLMFPLILEQATGSTPTAALNALADQLEKVKP